MVFLLESTTIVFVGGQLVGKEIDWVIFLSFLKNLQ